MAEYVRPYRSFDNIHISKKLIEKWKAFKLKRKSITISIPCPVYRKSQGIYIHKHRHTQITTIKGVQQGYSI